MFKPTSGIRRVIIRTPEDIFTDDDSVARRAQEEVRSVAIDRAIGDWDAARVQGDDDGLRASAGAIVGATSAAFQLQGVPTFAHPVLPPQFVKHEVARLLNLSNGSPRQAAAALLDKFDQSARVGAMQQFTSALAAASANRASATTSPWEPLPQDSLPLRPTIRPDEHPDRQAPFPRPGNRPIQHAPTWSQNSPAPPQPASWLERQYDYWFKDIHAPPPPVSQKTWERELRDRAFAGALDRAKEDFLNRGRPLTPEEQLRRRLIGDVRARGKQPVFFGPKEISRDDPYNDRVAFPVNPDATFKSVTVNGRFGNRTYTSDAGQKVEDFHPGTDFRNPGIGDPVFSPKNGTLLKVASDPHGGGGNLIFVLHDDGSISAFFHTGSLEGMQPGDEVYAGQQIGISDGSGKGSPHTHYSYFPPGTPMDPDSLLPMRGSDDHRRNAPARTQVDPFGRDGPYARTSPSVPYFVKPGA